jgi:hypothetical protein
MFEFSVLAGNRHTRNNSYGEVCTEDPASDNPKPIINPQATVTIPSTSGGSGLAKSIIPKLSTKVTNNEKTLLLSSDDEFQ